MIKRQIKEILQEARAGIDQLLRSARQLADAHAEALKKRRALTSAWSPADDVVRNMRAAIDAVAAQKTSDVRESIMSDYGGLTIGADGMPVACAPVSPLYLLNRNGADFDDLCWLFPEAIKARLEEIIRAEPYPSPGTLTERCAKIAVVDVEIANIEEEHTALVEMAGQSDPPIVLTLIDAVRRRQEREQNSQAAATRWPDPKVAHDANGSAAGPGFGGVLRR